MFRFVTIVGVLMLPVPALAGEIYGTIREGGKPVRQADIEIACGTSRYTARTDEFGSYRTMLRERGRCRLIAHYHGGSGSFDVFSYPDPVRYEFDVQSSGSGFNLVRR